MDKTHTVCKIWLTKFKYLTNTTNFRSQVSCFHLAANIKNTAISYNQLRIKKVLSRFPSNSEGGKKRFGVSVTDGHIQKKTATQTRRFIIFLFIELTAALVMRLKKYSGWL